MILDVFRSIRPVDYRKAHAEQKKLHALRVAGKIPDTLWLLEHPPVITTGIRRNQDANILVDPKKVGAEIIETERGGEVTYHGPGQLVGYLFVSMANHDYRVKNFVHKLEEGFIQYLDTQYSIQARHDDAHTGVWVGMDKITAIGIALRQRVSLHGFAFNVKPNLEHFKWIVPCGIGGTERGVTALGQLVNDPLDMENIAEGLAMALKNVLGYQPGPIRHEP